MKWAIKPLFLPSSGLFYDPIIEVKEPDIFLANEIQKSFVFSSESEFLYFLISRYTNFKKPARMKHNDAFFVWIYLFSLMNQSNYIILDSTCKHCSFKNKIKIDFDSLNIKFLNRNDPKYLTLNFEDYKFEYSYRELKHNIVTGIYEVQNEDKNNLIKNIELFFYNQCNKIYYKEEEIEIEGFNEIISFFGIKKLVSFFEIIRNEEWGIPKNYQYKCQSCNNTNISTLGDSFSSSLYNIESKKDFNLGELMWICNTKMISFEQILSIPISQWENINKGILKVQKAKAGTKSLLDEFGGE